MRNWFGDFSIAEALKQWADDPATQNHFSRVIEEIIIENKISEEVDLQELSALYDILTLNRRCV
jgi:hypothetical protein